MSNIDIDIDIIKYIEDQEELQEFLFLAVCNFERNVDKGIVTALLEQGAKPDKKNKFGGSPLEGLTGRIKLKEKNQSRNDPENIAVLNEIKTMLEEAAAVTTVPVAVPVAEEAAPGPFGLPAATAQGPFGVSQLAAKGKSSSSSSSSSSEDEEEQDGGYNKNSSSSKKLLHKINKYEHKYYSLLLQQQKSRYLNAKK